MLLILVVTIVSQWMVVLNAEEQKKPSLPAPYNLISLKAESYILPFLSYDLDQLEPFIETNTVIAHYEGHHEAYRKKMNAALEEWREEEPENSLSRESILNILKRLDEVPHSYQRKLRNNIGGFVNHAIYWAVMSPNPSGKERLPTGDLLAEIEETFGSYSEFKSRFTQEALDLFGSGYVWLVRDVKQKPGKQISILVTKDQDSPITQGLRPILVIDIWEHAYYLKHQFRRNAYINDWWILIDWKNVKELDQFWVKVDSPTKEEL